MRDGRRAAERGVTVFARRRAASGEVRLGCIVRGRGAVGRNRARRRARAALEAAEPPPGLDVVVRVEGEGKELGFQEMVKAVGRAVRGLGGSDA